MGVSINGESPKWLVYNGPPLPGDHGSDPRAAASKAAARACSSLEPRELLVNTTPISRTYRRYNELVIVGCV